MGEGRRSQNASQLALNRESQTSLNRVSSLSKGNLAGGEAKSRFTSLVSLAKQNEQQNESVPSGHNSQCENTYQLKPEKK